MLDKWKYRDEVKLRSNRRCISALCVPVLVTWGQHSRGNAPMFIKQGIGFVYTHGLVSGNSWQGPRQEGEQNVVNQLYTEQVCLTWYSQHAQARAFATKPPPPPPPSPSLAVQGGLKGEIKQPTSAPNAIAAIAAISRDARALGVILHFQ